MSELKKISTNIPAELLEEVTSLTGLNQTKAIIQGLKELVRAHKRQLLADLEGKIKVEYNPDITRNRSKL